MPTTKSNHLAEARRAIVEASQAVKRARDILSDIPGQTRVHNQTSSMYWRCDDIRCKLDAALTILEQRESRK